MKKFLIFLLPLLFVILFLPAVAACIDVQLGKSEYFPNETFQAEITGDFARALDNNNIYFYQNDKEILLNFKREQIAANKYVVYADLPSQYGNYKFSLKNVLCIDNRTTKTISKDAQFIITKPISALYSWLISNISTWPSGDEGAYALMALAFDDSLKQKGKDALLAGSKNSGECWPASDCTVKSTALALFALDKVRTVTLNKKWFMDSQNNVKLGLWELVMASDNEQQCELDINDNIQLLNVKSGNSTILLTLPDEDEIIMQLNCSLPFSAFVSHTYLGSVTKFYFSPENSLTLNNRKCFGVSYRTDCDAEATAYALWALHNFGTNDPRADIWLMKNAQGTIQKSISFMLNMDNMTKEWLINNQAPQGYWSRDALALSNEISIESTLFALESLNNEKDELSMDAADKATAWILQRYRTENEFGNINETSLALSLALTPETIEPMISFDPAIFTTKSNSNLTLKIKNNGLTSVSGMLSFENTSVGSFSLNKSSTQYFAFKAPIKSQTVFTSFVLQYSALKASRSFSIPILLWPATITESAIEEGVKENKIETSVLPTSIKFLEARIEETADTGSKLHFNVQNPSLQSVDVNLVPSWDLLSENVIGLVPDKFTLAANETKEITINIGNKTGTFAGTIDAKTDLSSASILVSLTIKVRAEEFKTCSQLGGKICATGENCTVKQTISKDGTCCAGGTCNKIEPKTNMDILFGIAIILVLVLIIILFLKSRLKAKPKKEIGEELKKIEEHYLQTIGGQTGVR